jgi:peptidoglycan/LPS O-acetylase OafA/YrhL
VRGIALIIVLISHLEVILPIASFLVVPGATVALDSFFVLSGFLITALLLREQIRTGRVRPWAFYRRRIMRIIPALIPVLIANTLFWWAIGEWQPTELASLLSVSGYYSNYYVAASPNFFCANLAPGFQHLWSLSFEEQFYTVWPWITVLVLSASRRLRTVVLVIGGLITLVGAHRALAYHSILSWCGLFHRTDTRADSILWGALLAHVWVRHREPTRGVRLAASVAVAFLVVCLPWTSTTSRFLYFGGFDLIDVSCAVILLAILQGNWRGRYAFEFPVFVKLGLMSYGIYLWHLPIYYAVAHYDAHWSNTLRVVVGVGGSIAMGAISWVVLERPLLRLRDRLDARKAAPPSASAPEPLQPS